MQIYIKAMLAVKLHLLATILCTQALSVYEGRVPYFPIEISRTAADSIHGAMALKTGIAALCLTLLFTQTLTAATLLLWIGLMFVAFCPDTTHPGLHAFGLVIVVAGSVLQLYDKAALDHKTDIRTLVAPILCAATVFAFKIALRTLALIILDWSDGPAYPDFAALITRSRLIMYEPQSVFAGPQAYKWLIMKPIMQVCGVLQWVTFYALSLMF